MDLAQQQWLHQQIQERLFLYCRAVDERDWELLRSCFGPGHTHEHGPFSGDADAFVEFAKERLGEYAYTLHSLSNIMIKLSDDGLSATSVCNYASIHRTHPSEDGSMTDMLVQGQYHDRLVCLDGVWLFINRLGTMPWVRHDPVVQP